MGLLASLRPSAAPPPAALAVTAETSVAELDDDDLEQVVGGLERVYIPGMSVAQG